MNKKNLIKMADYIETIPQEVFDMEEYRQQKLDNSEPKCKSIGCIIGHCTILDKNPLPRRSNGEIEFWEWSEEFTGICYLSDEWDYLFGCKWKNTDNTPTGAADRIRYFVVRGLPFDWHEQMTGWTPLSYQ